MNMIRELSVSDINEVSGGLQAGYTGRNRRFSFIRRLRPGADE
jgi:hypothetical protein